MAALKPMPEVTVDAESLKKWGDVWLGTVATQPKLKTPKKARSKKDVDQAEVAAVELPQEQVILKTKKPQCFDKKQSMDFGVIFDTAFGKSLAAMLGDIPVVKPPTRKDMLLVPAQPDCVEVGPTRIVGAIRPQNYDAAYRPDGPRIVYDGKTLNDRESIRKNWQNMVNDLTAEASTVHIRFPMCIVVFIVVVPKPSLEPSQERDIIRTLERLGSREDELDQHNLAESVAFVVWDPATGTIDPNVPPQGSPLRIEKLHTRIQDAYMDRYKNLPPHQESDVDEPQEIGGDEEVGERPA